MSLKTRIGEDINRIFLQMNHFAETHFWNGKEITCVPDDEEALKRKNNNVNDISWDNNTRQILIHVNITDMPNGKEPEPNTHIYFDQRPMKILDIVNNMGMLDIVLVSLDTREVAM